MKDKLSILLAAVLLISVFLLPIPPVKAIEWHVFPGDSIQATIDIASPGDIIIVHEGTYNEQIIINKQLAIIGAGAATTTITGTGKTAGVPVVTIDATGDVSFSGFTITDAPPNAAGESFGMIAKQTIPTIGVTYTISDCKFVGTNNPAANGEFQFYISGGQEAIVFTRNVITQYSGNAIVSEVHAGPTEISHNTFDAPLCTLESADVIFFMTYGGKDVTTLQNISYNIFNMSTASLKSTAISICAPGPGGAQGNAKFTNVLINGNTFMGIKDNGRAIGFWNGHIGYPAPPEGPQNNIISPVVINNHIYGVPGSSNSYGISFYDDYGNTTDATIRYNTITGMAVGIYLRAGDAPGTIINYNNIHGNTIGVNWLLGSVAVDARFNWWDDLSGPSHASNIGGTGDVITDKVDYSPWLGDLFEIMPRTYHVNPTGAPGAIQEAINEASPGDTIIVHEGTYVEQLIISKSLTLQGLTGAKILASDTRSTFTIPESSAVFDPIIFAYGSLTGTETISVAIEGFEIDGGNKAVSNYRYVGILCRNIKPGTISSNVIHGMYPPSGTGSGPQTFGILVYGNSEATINYNEIRDFSRGGIGVSGDAGPNIDPYAIVQENMVYGNGFESETGWWAENGIQIGYGATANVIGNNVFNCTVNNPSWSATGILVVDTSDVIVESNYVEGCDIGIGAVDFPGSIYGPPWDYHILSNILIKGNTLFNNTWQVDISNDARNVTLVCNNILNAVEDGIDVWSYPNAGVYPTEVKINYNNIVGSGSYGLWVGEDVAEPVDARYNWWGDASGPYHPSLNPTGLGDKVSDNVNFSPWLLTEKVPPLTYDIAITELTATPFMVEIGDIVNIDVTVKNIGNTYQTFSLIINYGTNSQTIPVTDLAPGGIISFHIQWDTTGETTCFHSISALAGPVPGEKFIYNNFRQTGVAIVPLIPEPATVKVEPSPMQGFVDRFAEVNVTINDLDVYWDLTGFEVKLRYNTAILDVIEIKLGDFAKQFNLTYQIVEEINEAEGYVWLSYIWDFTSIPPEERVSPFGSGTLFTIKFSVVDVGTGDFVLENVMLAAFENPAKWCIGGSIPIDHVDYDGYIETKYAHRADVNADGKVDIFDIVTACAAYASYPGHPRWNPYADLDGDGRITIFDIVTIGYYYGQSDP